MSSENDPLFAFFAEVDALSLLAQTVFERALPAGLTIAQFNVLDHFVRSRATSRTPAELAGLLHVTKATMTSTMQRLQAKGLISVTPDQRDRRSKQIALTDAGRSMREECMARLLPELARFRPLLGAVYIPGLTRDLGRVRAQLHADEG